MNRVLPFPSFMGQQRAQSTKPIGQKKIPVTFGNAPAAAPAEYIGTDRTRAMIPKLIEHLAVNYASNPITIKRGFVPTTGQYEPTYMVWQCSVCADNGLPQLNLGILYADAAGGGEFHTIHQDGAIEPVLDNPLGPLTYQQGTPERQEAEAHFEDLIRQIQAGNVPEIPADVLK